ncbi:MAG: HAMP domain-containing histidine kinase [Lachnospiraceae bacterium]|nr:HAMP domain-containing histidine kinase [Lachnospiraceae bacterium]
MEKTKNLFISISLSVVLMASVAAFMFLGAVAYDKFTGGENYLRRSIYLSQGHKELLAEKINDYVENGHMDELKEYAEAAHFYYVIFTPTGHPLWRNASDDVIKEKGGITYQITLDHDKEARITSEGYNLYYGDRSVNVVWVYLCERTALLITCIAITVIIGTLSLYTISVTATPIYKVWLFLTILAGVEATAILVFAKDLAKTLLIGTTVEKVIIGGVASFYILHLSRLKKKISVISDEGEDEKLLKIKAYPVSLRPFAESINNASENVSGAIKAKIKSERMKTELISNVSHDIKTPLTSIINFSDLIYKERTDNPIITEYAEHLHGQSVRMKQMMESLIEAAKASSGAVEINLVSSRVDTLIGQCAIEYEEKLKAREIELVTDVPEDAGQIMIDTKAMSRVVDNLMTNIHKYAMPGSRAYVEVKSDEEKVRINFRNATEEPINIPAEELMERFVRGDISRHSEGHGLGLSIVKSLMDLMDAEMEISAKYDNFEVTLVFDRVKEEEKDEEKEA